MGNLQDLLESIVSIFRLSVEMTLNAFVKILLDLGHPLLSHHGKPDAWRVREVVDQGMLLCST